MKKYSGSASFTFEIERYKNNQTGEFIFIDSLPEGKDNDYTYTITLLEVEGNSYFHPGKYHGPPEDSYPDEGETEITSVVGPDGKDWSATLSDSENDSILEKIQEDAQDGFDEPDYDDYDDRDYEPSDAYDF